MQMMINMTLDDLKTGMIVTLRNGREFTVIRKMANSWRESNDILVYSTTKGDHGWLLFKDYGKDMRYMSGDNSWDIVKVETPVHPFGFMDVDYRRYERNLIWKEIPAVRLTRAEIEARLGYKIEIVSEEE